MDNDGSFENSSINPNNLNNSFNSSGTIQNIPHLKQSSLILNTKQEFSSNINNLINYLTSRTPHHLNSSCHNSKINSLVKTKQELLKDINRFQSQSSLQSINNNFYKSKNNQSDYINKSNYNSNSYYNKQSKEKSDFNNLEYSKNKLIRYCDSNKRLEMEFNEKATFMEKLELLFEKHICELRHLLNSNEEGLNKLNPCRKEQNKRYHYTNSNKLNKETNEKNRKEVYEDWTVSVSENNTNNAVVDDNSIETKMNSARDDDQNSNDSRDNTNINSGSDIPEQHSQVIVGNLGKSEIHSTRMKKNQYRTYQPKHQKQTFETMKKTFQNNSIGFHNKLKYNNYGTNYNNGFHIKGIGKNTNK